MMKKILHISKYYFPFKGGTEQTARDAVNALKRNFKQKVICFNEKNIDAVDNIDDVEIIRCATFIKIASQSISLTYKKKLKEIIYNYKPDIIIFHYPNPFVALFLLRFIHDNTKLIIYWHLDIVKQKLLKLLFIKQNYELINRADSIIATSPNYIEGSNFLSKVKDKCIIIPSCINEKRLILNDNILKIKENILIENSNKIICFAVGRHTKYKGFDYLIEAFKKLDSKFILFIAGDGEETKDLKKNAFGVLNVEFLGQISDDELVAYLNACTIYCFPSVTKNEAFGLALAEAMYFEKPSITFNIPGSGVNFVSLNNITGIEVENKNIDEYAKAINKLANDKELCQSLGKNARERVLDNFLYKQYVININNLLKKYDC